MQALKLIFDSQSPKEDDLDTLLVTLRTHSYAQPTNAPTWISQALEEALGKLEESWKNHVLMIARNTTYGDTTKEHLQAVSSLLNRLPADDPDVALESAALSTIALKMYLDDIKSLTDNKIRQAGASKAYDTALDLLLGLSIKGNDPDMLIDDLKAVADREGE